MRYLILGQLACAVLQTTALSLGNRHSLASLIAARGWDNGGAEAGNIVRRAPQSAGLSIYVTNSNGSFLLSQNGGGSTLVSGAFTGSCSDPVVGGCWSLAVDNSTAGRQQTMVGFGAAITDTAVYVASKLSSSQQKSFLADFFSATGISLNFMRHTIGSSDLTPQYTNYTFDDTVNDTSLSKFTLGASGNAMLTFIKAMRSVNANIKLMGASWSPPGWMKANGAQTGGPDNANYLKGASTSTLANYFVKYIQAYASSGVPVDYLSVQNEPLNSNTNYPTMLVPASDMGNFVQYLGQTLKTQNIKTKLVAYDHNTDVPSYPQTVIDTAGSNVGAVGWHCYASNTDWTTISNFSASNPGVPQFMTECWTSPTVPWNNVADFALGPLQNQVSGVMAWTIASDTAYGPVIPNTCTTCRGLALVDTKRGTYTKTLDYYILGQFSKFIKPGAVALKTTGSYDYGNNAKLQAQAFLNPDGSKVVVIENTFGSDHLQLGLTFANGETYNGRILGSAITTWVINPGF